MFGVIYVIDTSKTAEELINYPGGAAFVIGKDQMIARQLGQNETRVFDLTKAWDRSQSVLKRITLTKKNLKDLTDLIEKFLPPTIFLISIAFFFIWKLFVILFYFLIALLLNLSKKNRLGYASLFSLAAHAITPVVWIQMIIFTQPALNFYNLNILFSFVMTMFYLMFGVFLASRE